MLKRLPDSDLQIEHRGEALDKAKNTARMVAVAARYGPYRGNCLKKSLVLWWLLRRQGLPAQLRIGVRKQAGAIDGHAWVEVDDRLLLDPEQTAQDYVAMA